MNLHKLSIVLDGLVELRPNQPLKRLATALKSSAKTATAAKLLETLQLLSGSNTHSGGETARAYFPEIEFVQTAALNFGTPTSSAPVVALITWLRNAPELPISVVENAAQSLAPAAKAPKPLPVLNTDVSTKYTNALLSAVPGTDAYAERLEALKMDKANARVIELEDIARRLQLTFEAGSSRPKLLKVISGQHELSVKARQKAERARGNSSA